MAETSLLATVTLKLFDTVIDRRAELVLILGGGLLLLGIITLILGGQVVVVTLGIGKLWL